MDLSNRSQANVEFMIEEITKKLRMATAAALKAEHFDGEYYDDLLDLYDIVRSKSTFSISEMEAIVGELGKLRKV